AHEPIRARPPSALYHLAKFTRRHKPLVAAAAAFLALLVVGGAVTAWQAVRPAQADRRRAEAPLGPTVQQGRRSRDVQAALAGAEVLRGEARAAARDRGKWAEARAVAQRAGALAEGGAVEPELAERVRALLGELNEEQADRRLVERLEEIRLLQADNVKAGDFAMEQALPQHPP